MRERPVLYAHRGASIELPENTLPAFRRALEVGAAALETDAHLTRDGHVVLAHDDDGGRCAGVPVAIRQATLAQVRAWDMGRAFRERNPGAPGERFVMPTLDELLAELPGVPINVDIKDHDPGAAQAVVQVVRRRRAEDRVLLASFSAGTLRAVRRLGYEGATGLGSSEALRLVLFPERVLRRHPVAGRIAQLPLRSGPIRLDTPGFVAKVHALGLLLHYWTIDDPAEARRLVALGADGIMTNDPARIAPALSGG
jgi:glycerophosphoryl diester phosphodiesterase